MQDPKSSDAGGMNQKFKTEQEKKKQQKKRLNENMPFLSGTVVNIYACRNADGNNHHISYSREAYSKEDVVTITKNGFADSLEWHRHKKTREWKILKHPGDRAVLCQSIENINALISYFPEYKESLSQPSSFAENVYIQGLHSNKLCIGDVFHIIRNNEIQAILEISNPRRPCYKVDMKHGKKFSVDGVRQYSAVNALAGWFFRVLQEGSIKINDELRLVHRPYPKLTLDYLSELIYGETTSSKYKIPRWRSTQEELHWLADLPALGLFRWREPLQKLIKKEKEKGEKKKSKKKKKIQSPFFQLPFFFQSSPVTGADGTLPP